MTTAGDIVTLVKKMNVMDGEDLGTDSQQTDSYIIFLNRALKELAHIAYRTRESDVLNITDDGYQTFLKNGVAISDMYSPIRLIGTSGLSSVIESAKRTSFASPFGWWRESDSQNIHTKGLSGNYTLHYVGYPETVADTSSTVDFPESGIMGLAFWIIGISKESRNAFAESEAMYQRARDRLKIAVMANEAARMPFAPKVSDIDRGFKF